MTTFDHVRYYVALVLLVSGPGAALFWLPIHPLASFWRRVGYGWAYLVGFGLMIAAGAVAAVYRRSLLSIEFGANPWTVGAGVILIIAAGVLRRVWYRQLKMRTLIGLPELAPERHPGTLLTEGAYSWVRHPRYLEIFVGFPGYALFCNYLAAYVVSLFLALVLLIVIRLEERELVARFGPAYEAYRRRVPALIPRFRGR